MNTRRTYLVLLFIFARCHHKQSKDNSIIIPIDPSKVVIVNSVDENGKKQGRWEETDTIHHRITKEFYYKDGMLDSTYLVYKVDSPDTLIFGYYKLGKKQGEWKYWDTNSNQLNRIETYDNGVRRKNDKY